MSIAVQIQTGRYKPKPARRVYIAKGNGEQRALSIQSVEDKIAQQATVTLLNKIYETDFKSFSMLRRCSQRHTITWAKFGPMMKRSLPKLHVVHAYPEMRFHAKHLSTPCVRLVVA